MKKKLPEIDLKELEKHREKILREREELPDRCVEWIMKGKAVGRKEYDRIIRELDQFRKK